MKELLIIRSVSFQQLDLNLSAIQEQYPDYNISILTHEHGLKLAEKYKSIDNIYIYPYKEGFKYGDKVLDLENKTFDVVIVPVTNISGVGFFNVLRYSKMIHSKKRVICNVISELKEISDLDILFMQFKSFIFKFFSFVFTLIMSVFMIVFLPLKLKKLIER